MMVPDQSVPTGQPFKPGLRRAAFLSLVAALLMTLGSIAGLLFPTTLYPTADARQSYIANDVVNLVIGLPILLGCLWSAQRGRLVGLLLWPGALLYVAYNAIAYIFGRPFDAFAIAYGALVLLSAIIIADLVRNTDAQAVQAQLADAVPEKTTGGVLLLFGILFLFRAISLLAGGGSLPLSEIGVSIADLVLSLLWIAGGVLLIRKKALGYASGLALLFAASMLFVGLIIFLLLRPLLSEIPFDAVELITVAIMGLVCFIPFGLFSRGLMARERSP